MASAGAQPIAWRPLGSLDVAAIGFTTCFDVAIALFVVHVVLQGSWLPYKARIPQLVACTGLAGILANIAVTMRYGMWGSLDRAEPWPLGCNLEALLLWLGLGALFSCAFIRVYRYHNVLVKCDGSMWSVPLQLAMLLLPFLLPPALFLVRPSLLAFDPDTQECEAESDVPEQSAFGMLVCLTLASVAFTLRLREACVQAPDEFQAAVSISIIMVLAVAALPVFHVFMEGDRVDRRRAMLVATVITSVGVFAPPLVQPFSAFIIDEESYECSGNYGLGETLQPGEMKTKHQKWAQMHELVASTTGRAVSGAGAVAEFYRSSLVREDIQDYFLRQASTMRILNNYVREGAPGYLPLSNECRNTTLGLKASSAFIFDEARMEILAKMGGSEQSPNATLTDRQRRKASDIGTDAFSSSTGSSNAPTNKLRRQTSGSAATAQDGDGFGSRRYDYRYFVGCLEEKESTPIVTPSPSSRASVACAQSLPLSFDRSKQAMNQTGSRRTPRTPALLLAESLPEEKRCYVRSSGSPAARTAVASAGIAPAEGVKPGDGNGAKAGGGGNEQAGVDTGKEFVEKLAGVNNVHAAFGLRPDSSDEDSNDDYAYSGFDGEEPRPLPVRGKSVRNAGDESKGKDLTEASKAIINPLFGDKSRAVGRQPGGRARTTAKRWDFVSRAEISPEGSSNAPARRHDRGSEKLGREARPGASTGGESVRATDCAASSLSSWSSSGSSSRAESFYSSGESEGETRN